MTSAGKVTASRGPNPMTHYEMSQAKKARGERECSAHDMTFGDRCLNCGYDGENGPRYNIVRFFRVSGRRRIMHRGVSLAVAQLHRNDKRTAKAGVYFDGYERA